MKISDHKKTTVPNFSKKAGFTLIEMMVAVFVFSVVMVLSTGAIFSVVNANKTSQAIKSVMDNLSSALDSMSREIRYGSIYHCGGGTLTVRTSCSGDNSSADHSKFAFLSKDKLTTISYKFENDSLDGSGHINRCTASASTAENCVLLTAPEVHIQNLGFYVQGAGTGTDTNDPNDRFRQPQVLITISGYAKAGVATSSFNIETMVDQRNLDMCKSDLPSYWSASIVCP